MLERRRLVQLALLGSLILPVTALAGCAQGAGGRPPSFGGGGDPGGKASGGGGRGGGGGFGGGGRGNR